MTITILVLGITLGITMAMVIIHFV
jgi:hypothetical protein